MTCKKDSVIGLIGDYNVYPLAKIDLFISQKTIAISGSFVVRVPVCVYKININTLQRLYCRNKMIFYENLSVK